MASALDKSPGKGERIRSRWSSRSVVVILFAALTPALVMTRVIGPHEEWSFWDYVAHVTVLTLSPATAIGLIRLLERRLRRPAIAIGVAVARRLGRAVGVGHALPDPVHQAGPADPGFTDDLAQGSSLVRVSSIARRRNSDGC